ncbi:integral membrane protein [Venturia nashicola]|uniref:Integral membrane protein n=1 Tax=Venturia nashicola TaxID=86259 RepID=A0A4Z1PA68_9PEZI|nr:integral membrane protein [Venturia nashicola]
MRRWKIVLPLALSLLSTLIHAAEITLDQSEANTQRCSGMYSKRQWGGAIDPFILVNFVKDDSPPDRTVSLIIFEYRDKGLLGKAVGDNQDQKTYICDESAVQAQLCNGTHVGEYLLDDSAEEKSLSPIFTTAAHPEQPKPYKYMISRTGYYCVGTWPSDDGKYTAVVEFRNAYGELPAAQIAKLPFYGGLTLVYAVMGIFWAFLYAQNRHDILPVQNYITAIIVFLVIEMLMTWGFYDYQNVHGSNMGSKVFMVLVSILNAGRNSFSFFLLLLVCMGYGVVKPSLGKMMVYARWLAAAHFVFGVIYAVASLSIHPDDAGPLILLVILPLAGTLTAFYSWTLNSLTATRRDLMTRKQHVKAGMYNKLWFLILGSILIIFVFFFFNSYTFITAGREDFVPTHWQTRWFVLDGWLNLVYLADVGAVAYIWRPTVNNRRFAMSDEIAQDDDNFEINSLRDSIDIDSDVEDHPKSAHTPPDSTSSTISAPPHPPRSPDGGYGDSGIGSRNFSGTTAFSGAAGNRGRESPLPAPTPKRLSSLPRESLDGETIFSVGGDEEDKWSEDEGDGEEREGLVGKKD